MSKVYIDGDYRDMSDEEYKAKFGNVTEEPRPEPTAAERLAALEAAVADLALMSVQENG